MRIYNGFNVRGTMAEIEKHNRLLRLAAEETNPAKAEIYRKKADKLRKRLEGVTI
jgi:hypothetical protein